MCARRNSLVAPSSGCLVRPGLQGPLEVGGRSRLSWTTNQREACLVTSILNVTILTDDGGEIYGHLELTSGSIEHFGWQGRIRFDPVAPAGAVNRHAHTAPATVATTT